MAAGDLPPHSRPRPRRGSRSDAIVPDPEKIITAGHENKTARTVAFRKGDPINENALLTMFKQIVANNRAGGWRKLKQQT